MKKFQLVLKCKPCQHRYKRVVVIDDDESIDDIPNPPCPKCAKKAKRTDAAQQATPPIPHDGMNGIIEQQRAPGIGGATIVKHIDQAAKIVMEDHHLSDLKDNVREGDTMAPSLPPAQQKLADNFFGPRPNQTNNKRQQAQMQRLMRRAVGGAYRASALDVKAVLPDNRVALRRVGIEPIAR